MILTTCDPRSLGVVVVNATAGTFYNQTTGGLDSVFSPANHLHEFVVAPNFSVAGSMFNDVRTITLPQAIDSLSGLTALLVTLDSNNNVLAVVDTWPLPDGSSGPVSITVQR
jgi:hypothetical protein